MVHKKTNDFPNIGKYVQDFNLVKLYRNFLINSSENSFKGKTIVLDGAFGASHRIAPEVFRKLGANVIASNCVNDGLKINQNCGALYPENLIKRMFRYKADMGFALMATQTELSHVMRMAISYIARKEVNHYMI